MIDVTVKTLDSQNHRYSVPDDITVKQFKDRIASSVNIPPDKQRLIYCGRVLQDEKSLSEYNVHEKVIHLVMRAPPAPSTRGGDRRANGTTADGNGSNRANGGPGGHFRQRVRANQGPSSSGVRLQQAKSMLDKAAVVISRLESADVLTRLETAAAAGQSTSQDSSSPVDQPSTSGTSNSANEPMETSLPSNSNEAGDAAGRTSSTRPEAEGASGQNQDDQASPTQELEALYNEMDALNSMDPPMIEGGHLMTSAIGNPIMGALSNSLQGGLFQAASAAFVSALSSMGSPATASGAPSSVSTSTSSPSTSTPTPTTTSTAAATASGSTSTPSTSSSQSTSSDPSERSAPMRSTEGSQASGNHPLSGVRGITVRITNRGSPRATGIRLEHPRCSVMVEVLDQYEDVQRRLQPFMRYFYRSMVEDRSYEENSRQLRKDQLVMWRVSSAMHYISHAMHAISDIMVDLRRNPPRQLRARPFIIPQPALVQAQINVGPSSDGPHATRVLGGRNADPNSSGDSLGVDNANSSGEATAAAGSNTSTSSSASSINQSSGASPLRSFLNMPDYLDDDNGVVFMHVGPNGITIDSLSAEGSATDAGPNPPPELIQNIMSSITSQLGMRMGGTATTTSSTSASSSSPTSSPGVRRAPPVHNSQATGNSGTNTTNATQTRVTPRAQQVHVTPLHVPGMGMTQFDPFLPCQSHHIRFEAARRRRTATAPTTQSNQNNSQDSEDTLTQSSSASQQTSNEGQNASTTNANANHLSLFANLLAEIVSDRSNEQQSEEGQQQEQLFAQLVRGVMSEVSGSIGAQGDGSGSGSRQEQTTTLQEFLAPFSGGNFFAEGDRDSIFAHLFFTVSQALSMGDLIQLFFGDAGRLNQLFTPLQQFVRERVLRGVDPSETNMNKAIDEIISDVDPHLIASAANSTVHDGIDYVFTIHNFIRHRLHDIFNLILNHNEQSTFGSVLVSLLRHSLGEFVALSLHCFTDGAQGLERLVEGRVQSIMSGMSPSIQAWSVNTSIMQLRSMMAHLAITDDHIRRYVVSPDEGRRMDEERQNRLSPVSPVPGPRPDEGTSAQNNQEREQPNGSNENCVEVMEVDELGSVEEITTSESGSGGAVASDEPNLSVTVGSQSWHSAVPQDWIPVITRDVERQRRGVPDTNLSDGYLCGVPLKRRKIAAQRKPHGTVQQVLQDTLRQSLRSSGVNRTLVDSVSNEVSCELETSFATHVRCALREEIENNEDFKPEKFPKSEQKIRNKRQ